MQRGHLQAVSPSPGWRVGDSADEREIAAAAQLPHSGGLGKDGLYPALGVASLFRRAKQEGRPLLLILIEQTFPLPTHPHPGKLRISLERSLILGCLGSHFTVYENPVIRSTTPLASQLPSRPRPSLGKRKHLSGEDI